MLDQATKKRIDDARNILVGVIPNPQSQVEQITIALIYKFMDDMDQESIAMGGEASFFVNEFERYSWSNIFDPRKGGYEMLNLYAEAIERMDINPHIPQLFRDIFKNAYLPYRDPEILKLFLKTINEFQYDHSERLGDAFEYLLSVLSSQGDAGQFRTPRHIIEFMVQVVAPQKHETILDPACGTAGFLISAYKYIRQSNTHKNPGDLLTVHDRERMVDNFTGYDISPDMVRLSLVNMYLHGFVDPNIIAYDTLTSEERWNEYADVILANPPFMSPKGGIRPHKKFSVQSKRSEVLFVDYMAEHLTPDGRAAIIVPEGVIFKSDKAYKSLRKNLIEKNFLWAVVSLPSGVFNPYAGVKTSILFLDKVLAKKTDRVLFVKVENDGYDLGAQRRPIDKNDLPTALKVMQAWQKAVQEKGGEGFDTNQNTSISTMLVEKARLTEKGEYNFTGERYRDVKRLENKHWELVELDKVVIFNPKKVEVSSQPDDLEVTFLPMEDLNENRMYFEPKKVKTKGEVYKGYTYFTENDVLLAKVTPCFENGKSGIAKNLKNKIGFGSTEYFVLRPTEKILPEFLYSLISESRFKELGKFSMTGTGGLQRVTPDFVKNYRIPLPPLETQREIVEEIEGYQRIIDGARMVVDNWKPNIELELEEARKAAGVDEWEMVKLGDVCEFMTGGTPSSKVKKYYEGGDIPWLVSGDIHLGEIFDCSGRITKLGMENSNAKFLPKDSVLIALNGQGKTRGTVALLRMDNATCNQSLVSINTIDKEKVLPEFIYYQLKEKYQEIRNITGDNQRSGLNIPIIKNIKIVIPPMEIQETITQSINKELKIIENNYELINSFTEKTKKKINKIWEGK